MITRRASAERGHFDFGWLKTWHTFSFGRYADRRHMGFGSLRVINDDVVAPGAGFPQHPHEDMEIVTYVLRGVLAHQDTLGSVETLSPGEVQRMSAGRGIEHSEFNASKAQDLRLLQIWIHPRARGLAPSYEQKRFADSLLADRLCEVVNPEGSGGALRIHQDARILAGRLGAGARVRHELARGRGAWVQVATGRITLNGVELAEGDGASVEDEAALEVVAREASEVLVFDLA